MGSAITAAAGVAGATNTSIFTAATNAGVMTAAGAGNTAVMNMTLINTVMGAAQTAASTEGQAAAGAGANAAGLAVVQAATDLVTIINDLVTNKKATRVVVLNLPDMSLTPDAQKQSAGTQQLILGLSKAFNATLQGGLKVTPGVPSKGVLLVDFFTNMQNNVNDPTHYALAQDSVTKKTVLTPVCKEVVPLSIGLDDGSSLLCTANGVSTTDANGRPYMFADGVHPTPTATSC